MAVKMLLIAPVVTKYIKMNYHFNAFCVDFYGDQTHRQTIYTREDVHVVK